jgi:23S rRNA pseudouridine1911/1915/1917 synthase
MKDNKCNSNDVNALGNADDLVNLYSSDNISYEAYDDFDLDDEQDIYAYDEINATDDSADISDFIVDETFNGIRIDKYLSQVQEELSRSFIQKLIESENITVDNKPIKVSYKVKTGDKVIINKPAPQKLLIEPENIPLDIVYEDKDIIIVNKQKGLVVHPAAGHASGTLVNALLYHCKGELSGINGVMRPGIVHRIDRDTTGLIVACKNDKAHQSIAEQLKIHSITRRYQAIVYNTFKDDSGRVEAPIGRDPRDRKRMAINYKNGKQAITHYRVIENLGSQFSYIECRLETGRTHQIRVHMASLHHPLVGDTVYGPAKDPFHLNGQALHAGVLGFIHPTSGEYVEFNSPLPDYFTDLLEKLRYKR